MAAGGEITYEGQVRALRTLKTLTKETAALRGAVRDAARFVREFPGTGANGKWTLAECSAAVRGFADRLFAALACLMVACCAYAATGPHGYVHFEDVDPEAEFLGYDDLADVREGVDLRPVEVPPDAAERGVTFTCASTNGLGEACGEDQNGAIEIGRFAQAKTSVQEVGAQASNTVMRSVSIAIGDHADARVSGGRSQAIAIGSHAQARANNAIAIGGGMEHSYESAAQGTGDATYANQGEAVAIGYSARAVAQRAVQICRGENSVPDSLQFMGVPVVRNGRLAVSEDLLRDAAAVTATNTLVALLNPPPAQVQVGGSDAGTLDEQEIVLAPGVTTTIAVEHVGSATTNLTGEVVVRPLVEGRRNYSMFLEEIPDGLMYGSLAIGFDHITENPSNRVYATPALYEDACVVVTDGVTVTNSDFRSGWRLYPSDFPCIIDLREPAEGVILLKRTYLGSGD